MEHNGYICDLFPVFQRVVLILSTFSIMSQARRDGIKLFEEAISRISKRINFYKADYEFNYPDKELSPKPFHKGGCYCNGGVSGSSAANVSSSQTKPLPPQPTSVNFVVTSAGVSSPVPHGATPAPTQSGQGVRFAGGSGGKWGSEEYGKGSFNHRTTEVWVMPATANQDARTYYKNSPRNGNFDNQKLDPFTGRTIDRDDPLAHIYHGKE